MKVTSNQIKSWRNGADGFFRWLADVQPRVLSDKGKYVVFVPEPFQMEAIRAALAQNPDGTWKFTTICLSFPRRHSKTTLMALLALWRFTLWPNQNIVAMATSERQIVATGFSQVKGIILNTPILLSQIGRDNIQRYKIEYPALQNSIRTVSTNISGLYGEKITCGWVSEIHAAQSEEPMQVLASSLGDTENSWLLLDSTVDSTGGPIHRLEQLQESGEDPTVFVHRLEYRDLDEALEKSPAWIRRDWLKSRKAQLLPSTFASQHLNQRGAASNNLFSLADIQAAQERLPLPCTTSALAELAAGRTYACGGGLDRAYGFSLHGDATIWTSVAKIADSEGGEPHYYLLNQQNIFGSLAKGIKKAIQADYDAYKLQNVIIEAYNAQDIGVWAMERGIPTEIVHATTQAQVPAFTELYRIVAERRLHFSDKLKDLAKEMEAFVYDASGKWPSFGCEKWHDDRIYSLAWAIHSLKDLELAAFVLNSLICTSSSSLAHLCYMRAGETILHCSERCPSHLRVQGMYNQYRARNVDADISLPDFFRRMVKISGAVSYREI